MCILGFFPLQFVKHGFKLDIKIGTFSDINYFLGVLFCRNSTNSATKSYWTFCHHRERVPFSHDVSARSNDTLIVLPIIHNARFT